MLISNSVQPSQSHHSPFLNNMAHISDEDFNKSKSSILLKRGKVQEIESAPKIDSHLPKSSPYLSKYEQKLRSHTDISSLESIHVTKKYLAMNSSKIYVSWPKGRSISSSLLRKLFSNFGKVAQCYIGRSRHKFHKPCYGFLRFKSLQSAKKAVEMGSLCYEQIQFQIKLAIERDPKKLEGPLKKKLKIRLDTPQINAYRILSELKKVENGFHYLKSEYRDVYSGGRITAVQLIGELSLKIDNNKRLIHQVKSHQETDGNLEFNIKDKDSK